MKRTLFLLTIIIFFTGCHNKAKFSVEGVIKGKTQKYIHLSRLDVDTPILVDSAKISRKGHFHLKVKATESDFYQLGFSAVNFITLLAEPGERISLAFEGNNLFENYTVSGSVGSQKLLTLDLVLSETKRKLDSLRTLYSKASKEPAFDVKGPALEEQFNTLIKNQRKKNIEFIISNTGSLSSLKALYQKIDPQTYVLYDPKDLQFYKILTDSLSLHYPNSKHVQALARDFSKEMNQMYVNQLEQITKDLPQTKLDPNLKNVDGKRIALSSLLGKYVLLTFWSVQSKESVTENLQLKQYYKLYSKKGFEIYQINLADSEEVWKSAVRFDELPWISTIEDDPKNPVNAVLFNVKTLPVNYLFDKEGKIIGTDLHGKALQIRLDQLFNNK